MPKVTRCKKNGKKQFLVDFGIVAGRRRRSYHRTRAEAETALSTFQADQAESSSTWAHLPARARIETARILTEIHARGATLQQVWDYYRERNAARKGVTVTAAILECLEAKQVQNVSPRYLRDLKYYLGAFDARHGADDIADISPALLEAWFKARKDKPATRQTGMNRLSALFSFCKRRGYVSENPLDRVERVRVPNVAPEILSVEDCQALVETAQRIDPGMLTYLGLALFCGIRPDEALRITPKDIKIDRGLVFLDAEKSKVRNRRIIELTAPAKRCLAKGGPLPKINFTKRFARLRQEASILHWPHDALRKTAASHFYNLYGIDKAVEQLGHSAGVFLRVYRELASKEDTARWLSI